MKKKNSIFERIIAWARSGLRLPALEKLNNFRFSLMAYDLVIFLCVDWVLYVFYQGAGELNHWGILWQSIAAFICIFGLRSVTGIYHQVWRYGGIQCYIRLLLTDAAACLLYRIFTTVLPIQHITVAKHLAFCCMTLLGSLAIRMIYRYAYKCGNRDNPLGAFLRLLLKVFSGGRVVTEADHESKKIRVAIIGAGRVGVSLAEEMLNNPASAYVPRCFIDSNESKTGRVIHGLYVIDEGGETLKMLRRYEIQEVIFAVPNMSDERKKDLYDFYSEAGYLIKTYDYPIVENGTGKRSLRQFDIEELLFRKPIIVKDKKTDEYYRGKVILLTGGGGSIGSEIAKQLAPMEPKHLILLDIYENGVYDVQQTLGMTYGNRFELDVEILSVCNREGLRVIFEKYHPDIVIHAAAHKHVPLMEKNCVEAVENNVFGTMNVLSLCEEYGTKHFMMVSTDKAVNPTNVMGATKRMCELAALCYSKETKVKCTATRFGNVLGSAGSVIPLFKKQISRGGPVTITDKEVTRYFMTIPEASQLVLQSGAMAENGELFVLDMGQAVRIYDLAQNMIRLSGAKNIPIVEIGLRPGEKLYEELLVNTVSLDKTDNELIFIDHENPISPKVLAGKLQALEEACLKKDDDLVRETLHKVIPTYKRPEEVNVKA